MVAKDILKQHSLRVTSHRCEVLDYFMQSKNAITHAYLEHKFKNKIDRVSLYRMLYSFSKKHILCKIIDSKNVTNYVFNQHLKTVTHLSYFKCKSCNKVIKLPTLPLAYINSLKHIHVDELNVLAEGTCEVCDKKQ